MPSKYRLPAVNLLAGIELARSLELAEARNNLAFVEARARLYPGSGACGLEIAGGAALYDGVDSPCTQSFGLGMVAPLTGYDLDLIEDFYRERGAPFFHEVSPLAGLEIHRLLASRGYLPVEFTSVMFRELDQPTEGEATDAGGINARVVGEDEWASWARISTEGWSEFPEYADVIHDLALVSAAREGSFSFLAEDGGKPMATGSLSIIGDVALLNGASTIPDARRRGAQRLLLDRRLGFARERGCRVAQICAQPGSGSQRNAERAGFRIAYTRIKWERRPNDAG